MKRFTIPIVVHVEIVVDAPDLAAAVSEAERIVENGAPQDGFVDGWNEVQVAKGEPTIHSFGELRIQRVDEEAILEEDVPADDAED